MADYEQEQQVQCPPEKLYGFVSDVRNLPKYMEHMTSAEPADGEAVHTTAEIDIDGEKQKVGGEAWFKQLDDEMKLQWGSEGPNNYSGELEVSPDGDGSTVVIRLHTEDEHEDMVRDGLQKSVDKIKQLCE